MSKNGITYRNYEAAAASIFTKCADACCSDDCPLIDFPDMRISPLPPLPDDPTLSNINSGIPAGIPVGEGSPHTLSGTANTAQSSAKCSGRLAKKRLAKKQRAEAECDGGQDQPPCWPFNVLPPAACPRSGGGLSGKRARKKEGQLSSMIRCVLAMLREDAFGPALKEERSTSKIRIVDFAGGSGHLGVPLALLLPRCEVVIVDLKKRSLDVARERAAACGVMEPIGNLKTYLGSITKYEEPFDIGLALHACGEATDLVLRACGEAKAAFITASCCVGKLQISGLNPYVYQANKDNAPTVDYPQSSFYRHCLCLSCDNFDALAKAADHAEDGSEKKTNPIKRSAKLFLEGDRLAYMAETYGYHRNSIAITRMEPLDSSPKNDILLGWFSSNDGKLKLPYSDTTGATTSVDPSVAEARRQLSLLIDPSFDQKASSTKDQSAEQTLRIDWTAEEEEEIRSKLQAVFEETGKHNQTHRFPTGMGSRQRRLIHFVAEDMGFAHWGEGRKGRDKIVCVAVQRSWQKSTVSSIKQ